MSVISKIKDIAHKVSEDYIFLNKDMNESLSKVVQDGEIENLEILKRVCEHANQNVYLSLFNDPEVDNSDINFDVADFNKVSSEVKKSEEAMSDYDKSPENFRSGMMDIVFEKEQGKPNEGEKLAEMDMVVQYRCAMNNLLNSIGMMKSAEEKVAENSIYEMSSDAKRLIANGESIGDIAKIASRHIKENIGTDPIKVASCYNQIHNELKRKSFKVKTGFTKISSNTINKNSVILKPVERFSMATTKIAALTEMQDNIKSRLNAFDKVIKSEIN